MPFEDATEARRERGRAIANLCRIYQKKGRWLVPSQTGNGTYEVDPNETAPTCSCDDFAERGKPCKHIFAVRFVIEREARGDGVVSGDQAEALLPKTKAKKPTYRQQWPAYNAAQTNEKHQFQILLRDLCRGIEEPPRKPGPGRKPIPLADMVFAVTFKIYSTVSARRFTCDLKDAHERGHISRLPHFNSVFNILEDPTLTPLLRRLIVESSTPLRAVEVDFAVDSTGFTSSRFVRWFDHKYGKPMQEHDWVKVSVATGIKTNIVTTAVVDGGYSGDSPQFATLMRTTAETFTIREASADAAYVSYANMDLVDQLGGTPYMDFRSNATGKRGGILEKMFHLYSLNREEYLDHYHKRSNVETTFSMVKAKFGDYLRSKTDTAMANEALCKLLCHNLCCLISSIYELGINPAFWGQEPDKDEEAPDVIPFRRVAR